MPRPTQKRKHRYVYTPSPQEQMNTENIRYAGALMQTRPTNRMAQGNQEDFVSSYYSYTIMQTFPISPGSITEPTVRC